jgi:hypothetical protein
MNSETPVVARKPIVFEGHVISRRKGIAYVSLTDSKKRQSFADCSTATLKENGITDKFKVIITRNGDGKGCSIVLKAAEERQLSCDEWRRLSETVEQALSDYKMEDDY